MRRRGRGTVWMTPRVLSQTASTAASALAMRVRWPHVWAATQSRDVTSMWAVEARSRPYGAGRAVEAASDRTLRRGYRGAPIALRGSDGHAKPPSRRPTLNSASTHTPPSWAVPSWSCTRLPATCNVRSGGAALAPLESRPVHSLRTAPPFTAAPIQ